MSNLLNDKKLESLSKKASYVSDRFYHRGNLVEYDMKDAGFSVIKKYNLLGTEDINFLETLYKDDRNIVIGKLRRVSKELSKDISSRLREEMSSFILQVCNDPSNILAIRNDSVFLNTTLKEPEFIDDSGFIVIRKKSEYMVAFNFEYVQFYYYKDFFREDFIVKGISDSTLETHNAYLLDFIKNFAELCRTNSFNDITFRHLNDFRTKYLTKQLPLEFYVEMNNHNALTLIERTDLKLLGKNIKTPPSSIEEVNINFNYNRYVLPLIKFFMNNFLAS